MWYKQSVCLSYSLKGSLEKRYLTSMAETDSSLQILHPKKLEFIELYRQTKGFISDITRAIGVSRQTYYDWLDNDKEFAMAVADAEAEINDEMKQLLIHKAQGDSDTTALIFWLKNKHPEFRQNNQTNVAVQINFDAKKYIKER